MTLATDKSHIEASRSFSDQKTIWNPKTRPMEKVQVSSNVTRVAKIQIEGGDVEDPASLGSMYETKVADARFKHEAFVHANKAAEAFIAIRKAYNVQGRPIGALPDNLLAGLDAVAKVNERPAADPNRRDPVAIAEAERTLKDKGFTSLNQFMRALGAQFEAFKAMSYPEAPSTTS